MNKNEANEAFVWWFQGVAGIRQDGWAGVDTKRAAERLLTRQDTAQELKPSQAAIDLIHSFESFKPNAYKDPGSKNGLPITIGWGGTTDLDGKPINLGDVWTREYADRVFARDLANFSAKVTQHLGGAPTTQNQFDAMVSFAYNVGHAEGGFKTSTLLKKHKAGDYAGAKAEFARWNKNDGKVMNGLIRRRAAEADLYGRK